MGDYKTYLASVFFNPDSPAAFSSLDKLYRFVRKDGKYVLGKAKIEKWLLEQESYAVHREERSKFKRRRVIVPYKGYQLDADTADMSFYQSSNGGYKYFALFIDIFSRYVWTVGLKSKTGREMVGAMKKVFKDERGYRIERIRTDKGSEYLNKEVRNYLATLKIKHFETQNSPKACYAERAIKTIKGKLAKYMTHKQTHRWINALDKVTKSYNNTYHRSIKQSPASVRGEIYQWKLQYQTLAKATVKRNVPPLKVRHKFKLGDKVRISYLRSPFWKQHDERWTREIYTVTDRSSIGGIAQYSLKDYSEQAIKGKFYSNQLLKAYPGEVYLVEKVLDKRSVGRRKEVLVKWKGWNKSYNSWIPAADLQDYSP